MGGNLALCIICCKSIQDSGSNYGELGEEAEEKIHKARQTLDRFFVATERHFNCVHRENSVTKKEALVASPTGTCSDCLGIITYYCELYNQIECLKLRLNWQIDKLWNIMKFADRVPSRVKVFREWCTEQNRDELTDIGTAEGTQVCQTDSLIKFRQTFKRKCRRYLKRISPRVCISPYFRNPKAENARQQEPHQPAHFDPDTAIVSSESGTMNREISIEMECKISNEKNNKVFFMGWITSFATVILLYHITTSCPHRKQSAEEIYTSPPISPLSTTENINLPDDIPLDEATTTEEDVCVNSEKSSHCEIEISVDDEMPDVFYDYAEAGTPLESNNVHITDTEEGPAPEEEATLNVNLFDERLLIDTVTATDPLAPLSNENFQKGTSRLGRNASALIVEEGPFQLQSIKEDQTRFEAAMEVLEQPLVEPHTSSNNIPMPPAFPFQGPCSSDKSGPSTSTNIDPFHISSVQQSHNHHNNHVSSSSVQEMSLLPVEEPHTSFSSSNIGIVPPNILVQAQTTSSESRMAFPCTNLTDQMVAASQSVHNNNTFPLTGHMEEIATPQLPSAPIRRSLRQVFQCSICKATFSSSDRLETHTSSTHRDTDINQDTDSDSDREEEDYMEDNKEDYDFNEAGGQNLKEGNVNRNIKCASAGNKKRKEDTSWKINDLKQESESECDDGDATYSDKEEMKPERKTRVTVRDLLWPRRFNCTKCEPEICFKSPEKLKNHNLYFHSNGRYLNRLIFMWKTGMQDLQLEHFPPPDSRHHPCNYKDCSKSFVLAEELQNHVNVCHDDNGTKYICTFCDLAIPILECELRLKTCFILLAYMRVYAFPLLEAGSKMWESTCVCTYYQQTI